MVPQLKLRDLRSTSTSTISSSSASTRSWANASLLAEDESSQRPLTKTPSLPVPSSPIDAEPLPYSRTARIPRAQVFLSRPATQRSLAGFAEERANLLNAVRGSSRRPAGPENSHCPMAPRCASDVFFAASRQPKPQLFRPIVDSPPQSRLRRVSSVGNASRVGTPAPTFWAAAAVFESANVADAPPSPPPQAVHPLRLPTHYAPPAALATRRHSDSAAPAPLPSAYVQPPVAPPAGVAILDSLRNIALRRGRPDPWRVPSDRTQRARQRANMATSVVPDGTPYVPQRTARPQPTPRVMSFDVHRAPVQHVAQGRGNAGVCTRRVVADGECARLSMCGDDYVGFMGVPPTRGQVFRLKSRQLLSRLVRRRT